MRLQVVFFASRSTWRKACACAVVAARQPLPVPSSQRTITGFFSIQDERRLAAVESAAERLCTEKDTQFERHVEAWKQVLRVEFRGRQVVDAQPALGNNLEDLFDPHLAAIVDLQCAPRNEPACHDREHDRIGKLRILIIEWAIDEDAVFVVLGARLRPFFFPESLPVFMACPDPAPRAAKTSRTASRSDERLVEVGGCFGGGTPPIFCGFRPARDVVCLTPIVNAGTTTSVQDDCSIPRPLSPGIRPTGVSRDWRKARRGRGGRRGCLPRRCGPRP